MEPSRPPPFTNGSVGTASSGSSSRSPSPFTHSASDSMSAGSTSSNDPSTHRQNGSQSQPQNTTQQHQQRQLPVLSTQSITRCSSIASPFECSSPTTSSTAASPRSEYTPRTPASGNSAFVIGTSTASVVGTLEPNASIRAAYKLSVRKKKSFHRNSWTPSPSSLSSPYPAFPSLSPGALSPCRPSPLSPANSKQPAEQVRPF